MQVRFWGTRGSIATPGGSTVRYGGNTACVELRSSSGSVVVLDCGTGARKLGKQLVQDGRQNGQPPSGCLLIGHTHWDHIQGLPFFAPLFEEGSAWNIYGPRGLGQTLGQTLAGQMQYQYFPVTLEQLSAHVTFHDLLEGTFEVGDLRITTQYLNHPALTLGYRIEGDGVTVAYACDHEPFDPTLAGGGDISGSASDERHAQFLSAADFVIHDTQYRPDEYEAKRGWGHSTAEYAVTIAEAADVGMLALFHHDPDRDDADVDAMLATASEYADKIGFRGQLLAAAEGEAVDVVPRAHAFEAAIAEQRNTEGASQWSATYEPASTELAASIVLAAADPAVRAAVLAAAAQEHLPILELADGEQAPGSDAVYVVDHDDEAGSRATRALARSGRMILGLTRGRPGSESDISVSDWLVWPSSIGHIRTKLRAAVLRRACRWQSAPLADDETSRIAALHGLRLLDTPPEERFDRYTREACKIFDVPFALVTLVDQDRQWFKSRQGLPLLETPRDQSVCAHAILEDDVLNIPDLCDDDRFADNPIVAGPLGLRFYAGVPLKLSDGSRVGTLCIGDQRPRTLTDTQLAELRTLADAVRSELEPTVPEPATAAGSSA